MNRLVLASIAALASASAFAAPVTYVLDPHHTYPSFEADHMAENLRSRPANSPLDHQEGLLPRPELDPARTVIEIRDDSVRRLIVLEDERR